MFPRDAVIVVVVVVVMGCVRLVGQEHVIMHCVVFKCVFSTSQKTLLLVK